MVVVKVLKSSANFLPLCTFQRAESHGNKVKWGLEIEELLEVADAPTWEMALTSFSGSMPLGAGLYL